MQGGVHAAAKFLRCRGRLPRTATLEGGGRAWRGALPWGAEGPEESSAPVKMSGTYSNCDCIAVGAGIYCRVIDLY